MNAEPIPWAVIAGDVARALLGEPNARLSTRGELRFGTNGSLAVHTGGKRAGMWRDHERGESGGLLKLIERETGAKNGEAVQWLRTHGFLAAEAARHRETPRAEPRRAEAQRIAATYAYHDADGGLVFQVLRYAPKAFRQRRPDGKGGWVWNLQGVTPVLYRLPELLRADRAATIYVTEGEKDADALAEGLLVATTAPGGAGKWRDEYSEALRGRPVVILPDNDPAGKAHAEAVARALHGVAASVRVLRLPDLPPKGDVSDWLAAGGTAEALETLAAAAPEWAPPEAATEAETPPEAEPPRGGLPLLLARDIRPALDLRHLVRGLLLAGSAALVFGPSNSGKTFLAADLALSVAAGVPWQGRATEQAGVVYLSLEGGAGFRNRVSAWLGERPDVDAETLPFAAITVPVHLIEAGQADAVVAAIGNACRLLGAPVGLVVIDTVSRALAGGDENDSMTMGALVAAIDTIRAETGAAVLAVHHTGKDVMKGARGHSLLRAAIDTEIEVTGAGGDRAATVTKQRDLESGARIGFRLRPVELGCDLAGEPVTSCVVDPAVPPGVGRRLSRSAAGALRVLHDVIAREGKPLPSGAEWPDASDLRAVPFEAWRLAVDTRRAVSVADDSRSRARAWQRAVTELRDARKVAINRDLVWTPRTDGGGGEATGDIP